jgi:hypothetical protein
MPGFGDKPVAPMPQAERQLLSEADVQRLTARRGVTTKASRDQPWGAHQT